MQLQFDNEDLAFRDETRSALAEALPDEIRARQREPLTMSCYLPHQRQWFSILNERGWSVPHWPVEYGGTGWSPLRRFIFEDEMYAAHAPEFSWGGSHMVGPVLYTFGSQEQKDRFLEPIRSGEHIWAQGFSEPGAGSDLVALRTTAVLDGDSYVINGQKIWTSGAYESDWGFFLVKTDTTVKPQRGVSFFVIDMQTPGLTIRRIPQINGDAHLCEVFFDHVRVPRENLVGEANMGWTYAKFLLEHERTTSSYIFWSKRELARARDIAAAESLDGRPLSEVPEFAARIARLEADVVALEWSVLRVLAEEATGPSPTVSASVLKLRGSSLQLAITELQVDLLGSRSLRYFEPEDGPPESEAFWPAYVPGRTSNALIFRAATIFGGTMQVQKNILAKLAFGF